MSDDIQENCYGLKHALLFVIEKFQMVINVENERSDSFNKVLADYV